MKGINFLLDRSIQMVYVPSKIYRFFRRKNVSTFSLSYGHIECKFDYLAAKGDFPNNLPNYFHFLDENSRSLVY